MCFAKMGAVYIFMYEFIYLTLPIYVDLALEPAVRCVDVAYLPHAAVGRFWRTAPLIMDPHSTVYYTVRLQCALARPITTRNGNLKHATHSRRPTPSSNE